MSDRVTILRLYHNATRGLLGDGKKISVIGWSHEESVAGIELDVLGGKENGIARVAYIFHFAQEDPLSLASEFKAILGFVPGYTETETLIRSEIVPKGARDDRFDTHAGLCPDEEIYILFPDSEQNRNKFRSHTREILYL